MTEISLASHLMNQHGPVAEAQWSWISPATGDVAWTFRMAFPDKGGPRSCLVEGCPGQAAMRTAMRVHFLHRNFLDTVVILD